MIEKYEQRRGAKELTMPQFYCFYREKGAQERIPENAGNGGFHDCSFYGSRLPKYVTSARTTYILRNKESFWRTFRQSELNGEKYYYQQVVLKKPIFLTTFELEKGPHRTWRGNYIK